jgi:hypothetical protein
LGSGDAVADGGGVTGVEVGLSIGVSVSFGGGVAVREGVDVGVDLEVTWGEGVDDGSDASCCAPAVDVKSS